MEPNLVCLQYVALYQALSLLCSVVSIDVIELRLSGAEARAKDHLFAAVSARFGLRSDPRTAKSGRTPKYLPLPQPTSATRADLGRLSMNSLTCRPLNRLGTCAPRKAVL